MSRGRSSYRRSSLGGSRSEARREIDLFRADHPSACRPLLVRVADVLVPELIDEAHEFIAGNLFPEDLFDRK